MKNLVLILAWILTSVNLFSQSCLPDGIDLTSQSQVDNFQANYPGCTQIEGGVEISGDDITDLNGLSVLTDIGGFLYLSGNDNLGDISGLSSLTSVGGALLVSSNPNLASLAGLAGLTDVAGDVFISNNIILSDISALSGINAANVLNLRITGNLQLSVCDNPFICNYLANPAGKVIIYNNATGCNNPPEIAGSCGITLPCLPNGDYYFFSQAEVDNFPVFYPNCTDLNGIVHIAGEDITSLSSFNGLHSIDGTLEIHDNTVLTTLEGLNSLVVMDGAISMARNDILTDISALSSLDTNLISFLVITTNPMLSECDIQPFCDYLSGSYGASHSNITGNAEGCQDRAAVLQECLVGTDELEPGPEMLQVIPNPGLKDIKVRIPEEYIGGRLSVYNVCGQEIFRQKINGQEIVIDISNFLPGIYFVRIQGEKGIITGKFTRINN